VRDTRGDGMTATLDRDGVASTLLLRLQTTEINQDPFPHVVLAEALPAPYYRQLVDTLPSIDRFSPAEYPGTGRFTVRHGGRPTEAQGDGHHGLVLRDWSRVEALGPLHELLASDAFARILFDRFSASDSRRGGSPAIPAAKHPWFAEEHGGYACVFALHQDPPGYEISPHVDNPAKIVTFLLYLDDDAGRPCGTMLCRPRPGTETAMASAGYASARQEGRSGLWLDWDKFDVVKEVGGPNVLFAFAPNDISYHAVRVPTLMPRRVRTVVRGFIARRGYTDTRLIER
jgi:hypothetical protein